MQTLNFLFYSINFINYNKLPISGRELYAAQEKEILNFLADTKNQCSSIIDVPNILDQNFHSFRFSKEYYSLIKKRLSADGLYINIIDLQFANYTLLSDSLTAISETYNHHIVFIFSNIALVISSDDNRKLKVKNSSIDQISRIIENSTLYGNIFYDSIHPFNNIIFNDLKNFKQFISTQEKSNHFIYAPV